MKVTSEKDVRAAMRGAKVTEVVRANGGVRVNLVQRRGTPLTMHAAAGSAAADALIRGDVLTDFGQQDPPAVAFVEPARQHVAMVGDLL